MGRRAPVLFLEVGIGAGTKQELHRAFTEGIAGFGDQLQGRHPLMVLPVGVGPGYNQQLHGLPFER